MTQPSDIAAEFAKLETDREEMEKHLVTGTEAVFEAQKALAVLKQTIKQREAQIWVEGGAGKVIIDGKNEKLREAQFVMAAQQDAALTKAYTNLGELEANIEMGERQLANTRLIIRGIDHSMQMKIEQMQFLSTPRFYKDLP